MLMCDAAVADNITPGLLSATRSAAATSRCFSLHMLTLLHKEIRLSISCSEPCGRKVCDGTA